MATWTLTFLPTQQVLLAGGKIKFDDLSTKLMSLDPRRFMSISEVENAITRYAKCLTLDASSGIVRFNREADRYARFGLMERSIQFALHESVPNMEEWQLYPLKARKNAMICYMGTPWESIPRDKEHEERNIPYDLGCDFRGNGRDACNAGCGVSTTILKNYGLI